MKNDASICGLAAIDPQWKASIRHNLALPAHHWTGHEQHPNLKMAMCEWMDFAFLISCRFVQLFRHLKKLCIWTVDPTIIRAIKQFLPQQCHKLVMCTSSWSVCRFQSWNNSMCSSFPHHIFYLLGIYLVWFHVIFVTTDYTRFPMLCRACMVEIKRGPLGIVHY